MKLSDEALLKRLNEYPGLRQRVEELVLVVGVETGQMKEADAVEFHLIEEMRRMGQETLQAWASRQVQVTAKEVEKSGSVHRDGKKTLLAQHVW